MPGEELRDELVQLLKSKGVQPAVLAYRAHDFLGLITQSVYVTGLDLAGHVGPTLDFVIDKKGHGAWISIDDIPGSRFGLSENQFSDWTLEDVDRNLDAWLDRLAALRGEDCPDCQGVPVGEVQRTVQRGCTTCRGTGRVGQAEPRIDP